jgi:hypothetical protein
MRPYVKTVRSKGRLYFYLVEPQIVGGRTVGHKVLRKLSEEEARSYGGRGQSNRQNQTAELQEHEPPRAGSVEEGAAQSSDSASMLASMTPEGPSKEPLNEEPVEGFSIKPDGLTKQEEFKVVPRPRGFYVLEPIGPGAPRGYVMVKNDGGTTRVFCGLCPGFTCGHVEFMRKWLRTRRGNSE